MSDCILWTGTVKASGYGILKVDGRQVRAHRHAWQKKHGPIPAGRVVHHDCLRKLCVNVEHMRLMTHKQHADHHNPMRASCKRGHSEWDEGPRWRRCRTCVTLQQQRRRNAKKNGGSGAVPDAASV